MTLSDYVSILALVVSFGTLWVMIYVERRMSKSQIDDNIMNAVNSTLTLLDKVKSLDPNERQLFVQLLRIMGQFFFRDPKCKSQSSPPWRKTG